MRPADQNHRLGFTLTELLIVILIIAVLMGLLLPAVGGVRATARKSSSTAFMSEIMSASAQFQAAERRLPGYFAVRDLASTENYAKGPADNKQGGFTQMESALIDLAGGVDQDQKSSVPSPLYDPATQQSPDRIRVGPWTAADNRSVVIRRSAIGAADGPGYLALPDQFVDPGSVGNGQVGSPAGRLMPDLVDAFGMPILMWQRDSLAANGTKVICADQNPESRRFPDDAVSPRPDPNFYLETNCGMLHAANLGKGIQRSQYNDSCFATGQTGVTNGMSEALRTLLAVVGHPAFPDQDSMVNIGFQGPLPAQARGDIVLESAGADGIYAKKTKAAITRIQYIPEGYDYSSGGALGWMNAGERIEKFDDIIMPGG